MDDVVLGRLERCTVNGGGREPKRRRARATGAHRHVVPALLALLLVAAVCPGLAASPALAASGDRVELLPPELHPRFIDNSGAVAGLVFDGAIAYPAIYENGNLMTLPGGPVNSGYGLLGFNDQGEVLVSSSGQLEVRSATGSRVLPKPVVDGSERSVNQGFGPASDGKVVGLHGWGYQGYNHNSVQYVGASPPTSITQLSSSLAMNQKGQVLGTIPGTLGQGRAPDLGILDGASVRSVSGFVGSYRSITDFSDNGHVLYRSSGSHLWHEGASTPLSGGTGMAVNNNGVVLMSLDYSPDLGASPTGIRLPNGATSNLADLVGRPSGILGYSQAGGINDRCEVLTRTVKEDRSNPYAVARVEDCEVKDIKGEFFRKDGAASYVKIGDDAEVRLRVDNKSGEELTNVRLNGVSVIEDASEAKATIEQVGSGPPGTLAATGPPSVGFVDFTVAATEPGTITLRADLSATKEGEAVTGFVETEFEVRQDDLVVNLELDPPDFEIPESDDDDFEPVEITATVSFTNATATDMTDVRLQEIKVVPVVQGQELHVSYQSGIKPDPLDPEVIVPELKAGETSEDFQAVFEATDDGVVEFSALATAADADGATIAGLAKKRWKAKPTKYVEITTEVANPTSGTPLLPAGAQIIINGTVKNLSNTATLKLGPMFPILEGNTGTMSLGYDGNAPNPTAPVAVPPIDLDPNEERTFQVRVTTNYSDPRALGVQPSGGTRAIVTFEPWGEATEFPEEGEEPEITQIRSYDEGSPGEGSTLGDEPDAQVKATPEDMKRVISIDDSIEIPPKEATVVVAGIFVGAIEGLANAAIATIYAVPDLIKMPYTIMRAAYEFVTRVWDSFTEAEKAEFLNSTTTLVVSMLQRSAEFGLQDTQQLYDQVYAAAGEFLIESQNEWQTGDYLSTTRTYTAFFSETIGSVAGPVVLSKMAQSPKAIAALERAQTAINAKMATNFGRAEQLRYVDNVLPILQSIENGAEPTPKSIAKLWGVTPAEVGEYQRICKLIGCIATIRSRHATSIQWIEKYNAMLKPEALKIKTVSDFDVKLGLYSIDDLGSVIFKKPEVLKTFGRPGNNNITIDTEIADYVSAKGYRRNTPEHLEAYTRVEERVDEWHKWEKTYKQWDERGWIDTTFNYEANAIPTDLTGQQKGNFKGFQLRDKSPGAEEYIVEMLDGPSGKFRRGTGDLDPVDFTYRNGAPLSPADVAKLTKELQNSPIGAEHGYTATFIGIPGKVAPGPDIVYKQFKPNEPALQIAPDIAPRATRIDVASSRWDGPHDYNVRWVNGVVDAGFKRDLKVPESVNANFQRIPLDAPEQIALPVKVKPGRPTVGRFVLNHGDDAAAVSMIMGAGGHLQRLNADGTPVDSPLHDEAFVEGPLQHLTVAPSSQLADDEPAPRALRAPTPASSEARQPQATNDSGSRMSLRAGATTIRLTGDPGLAEGGSGGFATGQVIAIGAGTDRAETRTIETVSGTEITLTEPLAFAHQAGDVVLMVVAADPPEPPATTGDTGTGGDASGTTAGTSGSDGTDATGGSTTGPSSGSGGTTGTTGDSITTGSSSGGGGTTGTTGTTGDSTTTGQSSGSGAATRTTGGSSTTSAESVNRPVSATASGTGTTGATGTAGTAVMPGASPGANGTEVAGAAARPASGSSGPLARTGSSPLTLALFGLALLVGGVLIRRSRSRRHAAGTDTRWR